MQALGEKRDQIGRGRHGVRRAMPLGSRRWNGLDKWLSLPAASPEKNRTVRGKVQ